VIIIRLVGSSMRSHAVSTFESDFLAIPFISLCPVSNAPRCSDGIHSSVK
jgi:hypothetical protein